MKRPNCDEATRFASAQFGRFIGRTLHEQRVASAGAGEQFLREQLHNAVHACYDGIVGTSLSTTPRQLRTTFDVALSLGIDIVREPKEVRLAHDVDARALWLGARRAPGHRAAAVLAQ